MHFRPSLFWDVDLKKFHDDEEKAAFIIGRVLDFGNLEEWKEMCALYNLRQIKAAAQKHVFADVRSANFWALMLHLPLKNLRCTRKLSLKTPKAFSMR